MDIQITVNAKELREAIRTYAAEVSKDAWTGYDGTFQAQRDDAAQNLFDLIFAAEVAALVKANAQR